MVIVQRSTRVVAVGEHPATKPGGGVGAEKIIDIVVADDIVIIQNRRTASLHDHAVLRQVGAGLPDMVMDDLIVIASCSAEAWGGNID